MKPPLPHSESAVPRTLHAQLEIAKAMRTLMAPDEDELLRRRRAEIAAIRGELEAIKRDFPKAGEECLALVKAELRAALAKKYNPDQPRVPAGNRDGGEWTSGAYGGIAALPDLSGDKTSDILKPRTQYAQAETNTRTDETGSGGNSTNTAAQDTNTLHNLLDVLNTIRTRNEPRHHVWSFELPVDNPRSPVEFVDSDGNLVTDNQGFPILRPANMPPERYVQAGLSFHSLGAYFVGLEQETMPNDPGAAAAQSIALSAIASAILSPVAPGGPLDAERFGSTRVIDYRHYLNIMIGVLGAAAGLDVDDVLSAVDLYARFFSSFGANEQKDEVYTHSAKQDVEDTKRGYRLYQSGRIRLGG